MIAEFEADLARSRTREGMAVAKAKGRLRGKQPKLSRKQEALLVELWRGGKHTRSRSMGSVGSWTDPPKVEPHASRSQLVDDVPGVGHGASQPVELADHEGVAGATGRQRLA
jgi:hypothetical protein